MANYVSKPADYGNYTQPINLDLVNFVMQSKQQKYDYNLAKLESKISDELGAIDLARTEDKKYFLDRANRILGSAGDISQIDFSNNNNARALDNRINTIVDDRVLNDVVSTSNYRAFQNTLQQKQKDGEGYDVKNAAYAMEKGGANSWLQGETDSLGSIMYDDYYDFQAEVEEIESNLERYVDVQKVSTDSGYYYIDKTNERLTESKIKDIVRSKLSDKSRRQMQINSWANVGGGSADFNQVASNYKAFSDKQLQSVDRVISEMKLQLKSYGDTENDTTIALEEDIRQYEDYKNKLSDRHSKFLNAGEGEQTGAIDNMAYEMFEDNLVNSIASRNAINRTTDIKRTLNKPKYEFDKAAYEASLEAQAAGGSGGVPFSIFDTEFEGGDIFTGLEKDIADTSNKVNSLINSTYSSLDAETKELIDKTYDADLGISKEEHIYNILQEQGSNLDTQSYTNLVEIGKQKRLEEAYRQDYSDALEYAFEQGEGGALIPGGGGINKFVKEVYDNPDIEILDKNGNLVSAKSWMIQNNINPNNAEEAFLGNEDLKNQFFKSYYADKIVTMEGGDPAKLQAQYDALVQQKSDQATESGWDTGMEFLNQVTGGQPRLAGAELDAAIAEVEKELKLVNNDVNIYKERLKQLTGSEAEADKILQAARDKGMYDTSAFWDNSFTDDNTTNVLTDKDSIEKMAKEYLSEEYKEGRKLGVQFNTKSPEGLALLNVLSNSSRNYGELAKIKEGDGLSISIIPDGDFTIIEALDTTKGSADEKYKTIRGRMLTAEVPQIIRDQVNLQIQMKYNPFKADKMSSFSGVAKYGSSTNLKQVKNVAAVIAKNNPNQAYFVTKDDSLEGLSFKYIDYLGSDLQPTPLRLGIEKAMDDGIFEFKVEKIDGEFYNQLGFNRNGKFISLYSDDIMNPVPTQDLESQYNIATYAPQIGVYYMLENILDKYSKNPNNPSTGVKKLIEYGAGK